MSRAPFVMPKAETAFSRNAEIYDTTIGWRFVNPVMKKQYGVDSMPETGRERRRGIPGQPRADQDAFALRSQAKAAAAQASGRLAQGNRCRDDPAAQGRARGRRAATSIRARPRSRRSPNCRRRSARAARVTAGNASGVNDGAAALIVAREAAAKRHGLTPIARVLGGASAGVAPRIMGIGPAPATQEADGEARPRTRRFRCHRAERGFRLAGDRRRFASSASPGRRQARQSERRRDRARPSARHVAERASPARRRCNLR